MREITQATKAPLTGYTLSAGCARRTVVRTELGVLKQLASSERGLPLVQVGPKRSFIFPPRRFEVPLRMSDALGQVLSDLGDHESVILSF